MGIKLVTLDEFIEEHFVEPVYCKIDVLDYNKRLDGTNVTDVFDFFNHPKCYESNFMRFAKVADFYIAEHFYGEGVPYLYTREDVKSADFKIKEMVDISCDVDEPEATTLRTSIIETPIYGYDPQTESEVGG